MAKHFLDNFLFGRLRMSFASCKDTTLETGNGEYCLILYELKIQPQYAISYLYLSGGTADS